MSHVPDARKVFMVDGDLLDLVHSVIVRQADDTVRIVKVKRGSMYGKSRDRT